MVHNMAVNAVEILQFMGANYVMLLTLYLIA